MSVPAVRVTVGRGACDYKGFPDSSTLTTYLWLPAIAAGSQHQGTAREGSICLAVHAEAQANVVELKWSHTQQ